MVNYVTYMLCLGHKPAQWSVIKGLIKYCSDLLMSAGRYNL